MILLWSWSKYGGLIKRYILYEPSAILTSTLIWCAMSEERASAQTRINYLPSLIMLIALGCASLLVILYDNNAWYIKENNISCIKTLDIKS